MIWIFTTKIQTLFHLFCVITTVWLWKFWEKNMIKMKWLTLW